MRQLAFTAALWLAAFATQAAGADFTGVWKAQIPSPDKRVRELTFKLKQNGARLTGVVVGAGGGESPISEGSAQGDSLSFAIVGPRGKMLCKGTFDGADIKLTQARDGSPELTRDLTLKKQ